MAGAVDTDRLVQFPWGLLAYKVAGAAAQRGDSLDEVVRLTELACARTWTVGVGLSPTVLPAEGVPTFELPDGEMEIGIGIHGEPGSERGPLRARRSDRAASPGYPRPVGRRARRCRPHREVRHRAVRRARRPEAYAPTVIIEPDSDREAHCGG
ncbi:MAG TPA: dihydroxyacetone kinase subunit DhaK [Actinoplanes sp.]